MSGAGERFVGAALLVGAAAVGACGGDGAGGEGPSPAASRSGEAPADTSGAPVADTGLGPAAGHGPASGRVRGRAFAVEDAILEEGVLTLREGDDFFPDLAVKVFLFLDEPSVVPEGRSWDVECRDGARPGHPHVHVQWEQEGAGVPGMDQAMCGYRLVLELGRETPDGTVPGSIELDVPDLRTRVSGSFEADIEGFRTVEGRVDLSQDDLKVAHHVAETWLAEKSGGAVEVLDHALAWLHTEKPEGRPQAGFGVYWWRPSAGGEARVDKIQFVKRDGAWTVRRALEPWQVADARTVSPRADLGGALTRRAAERFEEEHVEARGRAPVFVLEAGTSYNPSAGMATAEVRYTLDPGTAREAGVLSGNDEAGSMARYLFRIADDAADPDDPDAWRLERRLEPGEEVDFSAGRVVEPGAS